jgi:pteridine reductase
MMATDRASRRVLVVGATGRLGVAIAEALVDRGDEVVLTGRNPGKLEHLSASLERPGPGSRPAPFVCADLADRDAVERIVEGLRAAVPVTGARGSVDDIVLACGPFPRTPFDELRREDLERTIGVHCISPLLLVHALAGDLAKAKGAVVALGDAGTTRPFEHHVAYLTAKGAIRTGLRALAVELAPDVRVNVVELGIVADAEADADPLRQHRLATRSRLGRFGTPAEVVHVVTALLDATWATGETWGIGR